MDRKIINLNKIDISLIKKKNIRGILKFNKVIVKIIGFFLPTVLLRKKLSLYSFHFLIRIFFTLCDLKSEYINNIP